MLLVKEADLIAGAKLGKVVSFPTDTVPALAVKGEFSAKIFALKKRSHDKPLILMGSNMASLLPYVRGSDRDKQLWQQTAELYFPGALTMVLPASDLLPPQMNPTNPNSVGIRIPACKVALDILQQTGALATTSANLSGQPPLTNPDEIAKTFPEVLVLKSSADNSREVPSGLPSTVVKWKEGSWVVLREGSVKIT